MVEAEGTGAGAAGLMVTGERRRRLPSAAPLWRAIGNMATRLLASRPASAVADAETVLLVDGRVTRASRGARLLLADAGRTGATVAQIAAALDLDEAGRSAAAALVARGESFRRRLRLPDGRFCDLSGAPVGAACVLTLRDVTADAQALADLAAQRDRAEAEAAALKAALDDHPDPLWLNAPGGAPLWRNGAAASLTTPPEDARRYEASPGGVSVRVGERAKGDRSPDRALRMFIETVTEIFAHLRVGLAIFDEARRLTLFNPAVAEVFSIDPRLLAGQPTLRETLDHLRMARRLPEHADYPAWRARLFTLFDEPSRAGFNEIWHLPDGRSINVVARPHPLGGVAFIFEDMTPALDLEREKTTVEEVFRQTVEMLAVGVAVIGADGRPRVANPALRAMWRLPAFGAEEIGHIASLARACRPLAAEPDVWETIRTAVASGGPRESWTGRVALADGRVLDARISPMPDQSTLAAFLDVTDGARVAEALRERAEALEAAEEMRTALADQLSHRLRTPLTAVLGFAQMLSEGRAGALDTRQKSYVDSIVSAGQLLLESIENLADLAALEPDDMLRAAGPAAAGAAFHSAVALVERRASDRGVRLETGVVDPEARVRGDPAALRRLIYTLLADAVSRAAAGETVRAGVELSGAAVEIWCESPPSAAAVKPNALARRVAALSGGALVAAPLDGGAMRTICRLPAASGAAAA